MARKHLLANIGAKPVKSATPNEMGESRVDYARRGASRSMMQSLDDLAESSMRVMEGDVVVALDPKILTPSPYKDRIGEDQAKDQELLEAIKEAGQHQPILVRPDPVVRDRYIIVFGHRRARVADRLGIEVRAVIKPLEEIAHVVAQGQENSARDDLSFIEKSLYARRLQESGIDKATIKTALTIDDTLLSRMLSVAEVIPDLVLDALGAAKGVGRDRWEELKKIVQTPVKATQALELIDSGSFIGLPEQERFPFLLEQLKSARKKKSKTSTPAEKAWSFSDNSVKVSTKDSGRAFTLALKSKDASRFGAYLSNRLESLYQEFHDNGEEASD